MFIKCYPVLPSFPFPPFLPLGTRIITNSYRFSLLVCQMSCLTFGTSPTTSGRRFVDVAMALLAIWLLCPCQVGQKFELENEDDLKDKMDFVKFVEVAPGLGMLG